MIAGRRQLRADDPLHQVGRAVAALVPDGRIVEVRRLDADQPTSDDTYKSAGYGEPCRVRVATREGERSFVFHLQRADVFGHDRRADRAHAQLDAFDTFGLIPSHARALDVGAIASDGKLISLAGTGEFYLVTEWVDGTPYADDLRRIAASAQLGPRDLARADALCDYLLALHAQRTSTPNAYRRAIRDLVGHGEGIFGMIDAYPADTPAAPRHRLREIERRCLDWRWRLRAHEDRATRTHGDFHPFNVIFGDGETLRLLDASRGCVGDAADDVTAMTINFLFFGLEHAGSWPGPMRTLFHRFFARYLERIGDRELLDVVAPFFAWRGLVVASPVFYPSLPAASRDRLLAFVERVLDAPRFDPDLADEVFA